ncbi:MAG: phenylpropionate dioxygenase-like ring-hydroxylating dioxygenase large terminal subunit [Candidatus Poriferisodalaceae bacterium]|jgi:phenylpropionate dioxygenase-like ring-hydroxylating dioxygenase large terminal subunit
MVAVRVTVPTIASRLSQYAGLGSRTESREPSPWLDPSTLPLGHPSLGLRNRWNMLGTSDIVGDVPVALRALGEDVVLWRDGSGQARLMSDRCPHRGARLSIGDIVDGQLQCWYHNWRFDSDGQCTWVPSQGGACTLADNTRVDATYPVEEQAGYLWAWIGEAPPEPLVLPDEFTDPQWSTFPESVEWGANWMLALENLVDLMHAPFLHARSITLGGGVTDDRVIVTDHDDGFEVTRKNQAGVNFDWIDVHTGALPHVRLDIPLPPSAGPGPPLRILGFLLPRDDDSTLVHFPRFRAVNGRERQIWRTLYRLRLRGTHLHVLNQDKRMLESMRTTTEARRNEHLAQADRPVVHLRRQLEPSFEAQRQRLAQLDASSVSSTNVNEPETRKGSQ